jgi:hypothetical protein
LTKIRAILAKVISALASDNWRWRKTRDFGESHVGVGEKRAILAKVISALASDNCRWPKSIGIC